MRLQIGNIYKDIKDFTKSLNIYPSTKVISSIVLDIGMKVHHLRNQRFKIGWDKYETGIKNDNRFLINGFHNEKNWFGMVIPLKELS